MVAALVLGTGLPTSATYIITSIMAAPALVELGVPKLVAHMFVFYFGILADLTPPTAISTYATSSIAGADVWRTQWLGMMLALSGFIIPFSFVYDPALLLINASVPHIVLRTLAATLGIVMLGAGLIGYFRDADPSLGARAAPGRRAAADLSRRLDRCGRDSLLRRGSRLAARRSTGRRHGGSVMAQGIRDFVAGYERAFPGEVVHVTEPVTTDHDIMALVLEYERRRRWPILLFEKVTGADMPIIANVVASRTALAWALGVPEARLAREYARRIKDTIKPTVVARAPFHERVLTGADLDLGRAADPDLFPG